MNRLRSHAATEQEGRCGLAALYTTWSGANAQEAVPVAVST